MTPPRAPAGAALAACLILGLISGGCTSAREHRDKIDRISSGWAVLLEEGQQEEVIESVRALADLDASKPETLLSLQALLRQAHPRGNTSMLVRAECLRAAWTLGSQLPAEELRSDDLTPAVFSERTREFEQLTLDPATPDDDLRVLELARFLGEYRFPPGSEDLALDLADMVVSRGVWGPRGAVTDTFLHGARGCSRHALVLLTLRLADDPYTPVREQALAGARYMHPGPGLDLVAGALGIERDREVLLKALDSLAALHGVASDEDILRVLQLIPFDAELTIRRQADQIRELVSA